MILIFEKTHFSSEEIPLLTTSLSSVTMTDQNDIYAWCTANMTSMSLPGRDLRLQIIFPATAAHIKKYSFQAYHMVKETPQLYVDVVQPYILSQPESKISWVYNILNKIQESESILYEDPHPINGFIILPDSKWDRRSLENFYVQAILHRRDLKSLRDLRAEHLPLLINIRESIATHIPQKFPDLKFCDLRIYIHYQPTYCT